MVSGEQAAWASGRLAGNNAQGGMALAIVVWFIAGMSLLVAGIVAQARVDTQMSQVHLARAKAVAAGDGAIKLMLADLVTDSPGVVGAGGMPMGNYRLGDIDVIVRLVPRAGLIDMRSASPEVLAALFVVAGGIGEEQAAVLADNVLQSRTAGRGAGDRNELLPQLDAMEDLLQIPGLTRTLLDSLRDFIVVDKSARGTDWSLVPEPLLRLLEYANPAQAEAVRARREARTGAAGASRGGQAPPTESAYRADALVRYGDKTWLRRRWISMEPGASSALPWRVVRTEPPRVLLDDSILISRSTDA